MSDFIFVLFPWDSLWEQESNSHVHFYGNVNPIPMSISIVLGIPFLWGSLLWKHKGYLQKEALLHSMSGKHINCSSDDTKPQLC